MSLEKLLQMAGEVATTRAAPPDCDRLLTLLVDDEPALLAELTGGLEALGLDVIGVGDATAALAQIRADARIAVLLTDMKMPRISGIELLREAMASRGEAAALEGIISTAHTSIESVTSAMRGGAIDFLAKPFGLLEAASAVRRALERAVERRRQARFQAEALAAAEATAAVLADRMVASLQGGQADAVVGREDRARILAHELRTPLVPVLGYAELLANREVAPADVRLFAEEIRHGALRLLASIDRLLEFEALFRPGVAARPAEMATARLFNEAVAAQRLAAEASQVTLLVAPGGPLRVQADPVLLHRALAELLRNAVAASPAGGVVRLAAEHSTAGVRLLVQDSGPGLPALPANDAATLQRPDGALGLGLPMARRIAELHGGSLDCRSLPEGGSEVVLWLPAG